MGTGAGMGMGMGGVVESVDGGGGWDYAVSERARVVELGLSG